MATKKLSEGMKTAIVLVSDEFARMMSTPLTSSRQRFLAEILAVTRAAAIGGEYRDALKGYEVMGKILGHVSDAPQQHLHLHRSAPGAPMADKTDEELLEMLHAPAPPEPPRLEATPEQREDLVRKLDEVEAEAVLYA
jgi:hypothetical protein